MESVQNNHVTCEVTRVFWCQDFIWNVTLFSQGHLLLHDSHISLASSAKVQGHRGQCDLHLTKFCETMLCEFLSWSKIDPTLVHKIVLCAKLTQWISKIKEYIDVIEIILDNL